MMNGTGKIIWLGIEVLQVVIVDGYIEMHFRFTEHVTKKKVS